MKLLQQGLVAEKLSQEVVDQTIASYKGRIKHCWSKKLETLLIGKDKT